MSGGHPKQAILDRSSRFRTITDSFISRPFGAGAGTPIVRVLSLLS
jgi:hypothetical protein